ncbi:unnamed protein product, partial [Polarella glacialis]
MALRCSSKMGFACILAASASNQTRGLPLDALRGSAEVPQSACIGGSLIPNSDRAGKEEDNSTSRCFAAQLGDECRYQCDPGYIAVGRHVCQSLEVRGRLHLNRSFFGGRCVPLCPSSAAPCVEGPGGLQQVPLRVSVSDGHSGFCLNTTCMAADDALRSLARGNYKLWRMARSELSGVYTDH